MSRSRNGCKGRTKMSSADRAFPVYCPFCGDEDLRPHSDVHGTWECRSCTRVFSLKFLGLFAPLRSSELQHSPSEARRDNDPDS